MPPKPRPRPRPRATRPPAAEATSTATELAHDSSTSPAKGAAQVKTKAPLLGEDDLFIRNKGRSLRKLEQRVAGEWISMMSFLAVSLSRSPLIMKQLT
jgi:hypothetical protein